MNTLILAVLVIGVLGGAALVLAWPADDHHVDLPADHPLQVLPGTRIIENGEYR